MMPDKIFKFSRVAMIFRLIIYLGFLGLSIYVFQKSQGSFIIAELVLTLIVVIMTLIDFSYLSKDIILTDKRVILVPFGYRLIKFPVREEIPIDALRRVELSSLFAHGILVKFTSTKTYFVFAGDILTLDKFIDGLKLKVPKNCLINTI